MCALPKGGALIFSDRLLHASTPNTAKTDRFSLISTLPRARRRRTVSTLTSPRATTVYLP